jgi:para-aminobenzoate synthetase component 1
MRKTLQFLINQKINSVKEKILHWASVFDVAVYFDNHQYKSAYSTFECLIGADPVTSLQETNFNSLKSYLDRTDDWVMGFISYDVKNETEHLSSKNPDHINMPLMHFFCPRYLIFIRDGMITIQYYPDPHAEQCIENLYASIQDEKSPITGFTPNITTTPKLTKSAYLDTVNQIIKHIYRGDIFEMNFCQEFYATPAFLDPLWLYLTLKNISPAPFSCYYKLKQQHLISASPERFIKKTGQNIISQPIKGTIKRGKTAKEDELLKQQLLNDPKERAENVMIVDLVRNDLAKTARKGSVKIEELFGIYSFKQVHQMISTVSSVHDPQYHPADIIKHAFPMGSMTGAPKVRAMELIEQYESSQRGLYSGTVGYFTPAKDFDFNVVIRSFLYNEVNNYLSFHVGGAITANSIPENEYKECLLKAKAMTETLNSKL